MLYHRDDYIHDRARIIIDYRFSQGIAVVAAINISLQQSQPFLRIVTFMAGSVTRVSPTIHWDVRSESIRKHSTKKLTKCRFALVIATEESRHEWEIRMTYIELNFRTMPVRTWHHWDRWYRTEYNPSLLKFSESDIALYYISGEMKVAKWNEDSEIG